MEEIIDIEDIQVPVIDIKDIQLKPYNNNGIRLYMWNDMVRCDVDGKQYFTAVKYLRMFILGKLKFCYLSDKFKEYSDEERKAYNEKVESEFNERVKKSLRNKIYYGL